MGYRTDFPGWENKALENEVKLWDEAVGRWNEVGLLHGVDDPHHRRVLAVLLDNMRQVNDSRPSPELVRVFMATSIPLVRRVVAGWFLHRLVSVQPFTSPNGGFHYRRFDGTTSVEPLPSRSRKLKAKPPEVRGEFDPRNEQQLHQLSELTQLVADQTIREVTSEVLSDIRNNSGLTATCNLAQLPDLLGQTVEKMAERLQADPQLWFLGSPDMAEALGVTDIRPLAASYQEGVFGGRPFFIDPLQPTKELQIGHRGRDWFDAGYFYGPYQLFIHSPLTAEMVADRDAGRAEWSNYLVTRYAKKMMTGVYGVYPKGVAYYAKLTVTDVEKAPDPDEAPQDISVEMGGESTQVVEDLGAVKVELPDTSREAVLAQAKVAVAHSMTHDADAVAEDAWPKKDAPQAEAPATRG